LNLVWIGALVALWAGVGRGDGSHLAMTRFLAWGVLVAGTVQVVAHFPILFRLGLLGRGEAAGTAPSSTAAGTGPTALDVLRRSAPLALGAAVYQVNVMVDGLMAESMLANGGPTLHYYANRVQQFPMAMIAFAATSAVFPALQALGHGRDLAGVRRLHDRTHRAIAFVALPASVGLFVLAGPVIGASFEHGAFGAAGVERAASALRWLSLAILPAGAAGLVARTYYALGDFRHPVRVSSVLLVVNVVLNLGCVQGLGMDVDGLALSTGLTSWIGLVWLLRGLKPRLGLPSSATGLGSALARMLAASVPCGLAAHYGYAWVLPAAGRGVAVLAAITLGVAAYAAAVEALAVPEARELRRRIGDRFARRGRGA
jgi:putative peptidoglycan lipid II flippase